MFLVNMNSVDKIVFFKRIGYTVYAMKQPQNGSRMPTSSGLKKGLIALLCITLAIIVVLSSLGLAGAAGDMIEFTLARAFGTLRFAIPLLLILLAYRIDRSASGEGASRDITQSIGGILLLLSIAGLVHTGFQDDLLSQAEAGKGGGFVGYGITALLIPKFGIWATRVLLAAVLLAALLMLLHTSLTAFLRACGRFFIYAFSWLRKGLVKKNTQENTAYGLGNITFIRRLIQPKTKSPPPREEQPPLPVFDEDKDARAMHAPHENGMEVMKLHTPRTAITELPPLRLLKRSTGTASAGDITRNIQIIEKTFKTFGIDVEMGETRVGPSVTQYTLRPADGIKLSRITGLGNDLALALAAHPIRIEAPIPGKSLVGIEVPNQKSAIVTLHDLLNDEEYEKVKQNYHIGLGKDVSGKAVFAHLPSLPHLLVAGATGSGKTVCINSIIVSLIFQHTPQQLRFIMVDPKRVELPLYNGIPHLLTPVITDTSKTINALKWTIGEMERRFDLLSTAKCRDIASYNQKAERSEIETMPVIVFIVDELADLMVAAGAEIEAGIIRLAQMARAVGIHLILATQRPSVDIITGLIKANIPGRIAFSVASLTDSRTILDCAGAEKLLGRGDMLFANASLSKPKRIQGALVSEEEMKRIIEFVKHDEPPTYNDAITDRTKQMSVFGDTMEVADDPLYPEAKEMVIVAGKASASYLQRRLKVGYARAARLLDILEEQGVIGPGDGAKPREVLIRNNASVIIPSGAHTLRSEWGDGAHSKDDITEEKFDELR